MLINTITFTRPSTSVPFFTLSDELKAQFLENFRYTGKSPEVSTTTSADGLTSVVATKWKTRATWAEYIEAPLSQLIRDSRISYQVESGIQSTTEITYVPSPGDEGEGYVAPEVPAEQPAQG